MKRFLLAVVCTAWFAPGAVAQSLDCSDRLSSDEKVICDSKVLSRLDVELQDVYEDVLSKLSTGERDRLRSEQRDWVGTRRACRDRRLCLKRLYRDRISELEDRKERNGGGSRLGEATDGRDRWAALGSVKARESREPLTILVGFSRGRFDALQLRVRDANSRIRKLTVVYGDGSSQSFKFRRRFRAGQLSDRIELRSRKVGRFIQRVVIEARARRGSRIDIIGRRAGRGVGDNRRFDDDRYSGRDQRDDTSRSDRYLDNDRFADRDPGRFEDREFGDRDDRDRDLDDRDDQDDRDRDDDQYSSDREDRYDRQDRDTRDRYGDDERAVVSRSRMLDFVKDVFHRTAEMSSQELRETYASRADYYGERRKSVEDIIRDKRNYAERWSDRAFRVRDETFRYEETPEAGVYELTYTYDFHVRGNGRESKGVGETTLLVDASGERYVIVKEDGKVVKRL